MNREIDLARRPLGGHPSRRRCPLPVGRGTKSTKSCHPTARLSPQMRPDAAGGLKPAAPRREALPALVGGDALGAGLAPAIEDDLVGRARARGVALGLARLP